MGEMFAMRLIDGLRMGAFRVLLTVAVATAWGVGFAGGATQDQRPEEPPAWHEVYRKDDTWPETMLLARARYRRWRVAGPSDKAFAAVDLALRRIRLADSTFAIYEHRVTRDWAALRLPDAS